MDWVKKGLIYAPDGSSPWARTAAMVPTPVLMDKGTIRVYATFCDGDGIGRPGYVDVSSEDPKTVLEVSKEPLLDIGEPGTFDENGVLACSYLKLPDGSHYMYYVGFELGHKIRYRLLTGLAISHGGKFRRIKKTPILERSDSELYFRGGPFVMLEGGVFRMWYVAGSSWTEIDGKQMPVYSIRYMESKNGVDWPEEGKVCIDIEDDSEHGFGRPFVVKENGAYRMFYSKRVRGKGYRLGYAESPDGMVWKRNDKELGLDVSDNGWDSEMVCYSSVIKALKRTYMFYNGNGLGNTGFGYAELKG